LHYTLQFGEVLKHIPDMLWGAAVTLEITFIAFWLGAVIGSFGAMAKVYGGTTIRTVVSTYVLLFMNTPALIQINAGAYLTEVMRSGVSSVRQTEMDAAEVLGMTRLQSFRFVVLPHIARTIYAPLSNFFIWLLLGSSIAGLFGVQELTGTAIDVGATTFRSIEVFLVAGGLYVALTVIASAALYAVGLWGFHVKARIF
jgi:polar amino acid transport system permease protein